MFLWKNIVGVLILILLAPIHLSGQVVTGRIIDKISGLPVEFATAYINGTTNGTMSDQYGAFKLTGVKFPCEVVISHLSYNPFVFALDSYQDTDLRISLSPKVVEINEITIVNQNLRDENIRRFCHGLLGAEKWGEEAILLNDSVLKFQVQHYGENIQERNLIGQTKVFRVTASAPLKIDLPLLGYELQYDLVNYIEKFNPLLDMNVTSILGYSYFKEIFPDSRREERKYRKNRMEAYFFSTQHFTRSLYQKKLMENGYLIFKYTDGQVTKYYEEFYIDSCDCLTYTNDGAMITGLEGEHFLISYYQDSRGYPINLESPIEYYPSARRARFHILSDTCLIRADGSRPGNSIVFDENIGVKRIGASLPDDYIPEYH